MAATYPLQLKFLVEWNRNQKGGGRILFAEADKKFIDLLFSLLTMPLATVTRILRNESYSMGGSLTNLYQSVEVFNDTYLRSNETKESLLKPTFTPSPNLPDFLPGLSHSTKPKLASRRYCPLCSGYLEAYHCDRCDHSVYFGEASGTIKPKNGEDYGMYVKGGVSYMVMDDLSVKPMSTISSISVLNKFNIKGVSSLEEKVITLDAVDGVKLLQASLRSKTVLTDVFLGRMMREVM